MARSVMLWGIGVLLKLLVRVHDDQTRRVPQQGPLILATNHINFLDMPLLYITLRPRPITGLVKIESWDSPLLGLALDLIGNAVAVRRGEADMAALRQGVGVVKAGFLLAVAPEGTRTNDGRLIQGHPGVAMLAMLSKSPILPVAHYGGEQFRRNLKRLRRTDVYLAVGRPFYVDAGDKKVTKEVRQQMVDEIMYELAALMPDRYRGYYSDLSRATTQYIRFTEM